MKKLQKSLAIFMAICMVLAVMPVKSFAADRITVTVSGKVFKSDGITPVAGVCVYLLDAKYGVEGVLPEVKFESEGNLNNYEVIDYRYTEGQYAHAVTDENGSYTITADVPAGNYHVAVDYAVKSDDSLERHTRKIMAVANNISVSTTSVSSDNQNITLPAAAGFVSGNVHMSDSMSSKANSKKNIEVCLVPKQILDNFENPRTKNIASAYTDELGRFTLVTKENIAQGDYAVSILHGTLADKNNNRVLGYEFSYKMVTINNNFASNVSVELEPSLRQVEVYPGITSDRFIVDSLYPISVGDTISLKKVILSDGSEVTDPDVLAKKYTLSACLCEGFFNNRSPWWDTSGKKVYIQGDRSTITILDELENFSTGEKVSPIGYNIWFAAHPIDYIVNSGTEEKPYYQYRDIGGGTTSYMAFGPIAAEPQKINIEVSSATVAEKEYDGKTSAIVTNISFNGLEAGETLKLGVDYDVENAKFDTPDVGTNKSVTAMVKLINPLVSKKYKITNPDLNTLGNIKQSTYNNSFFTGSANVICYKASSGKTFNLCGIIPSDLGRITFKEASVKDNAGGVIKGTPQVNSSGLMTYDTESVAAGKSSTIEVSFNSQNYSNDFKAVITVTTVEKAPVTISGVSAASNLVYNGKEQPGYTGTAVVSGNLVSSSELVYTYNALNTSGTAIKVTRPVDAGDYRLVISVPETNELYAGSSAEIAFTIGKKSLTVKPKDEKIYNGSSLPTPQVEYAGIEGNDVGSNVAILSSGSLDMEIKNIDNISKLTGSAINGTYAIKFTGSPVFMEAKNYNITTADGALTITNKSSGGGGGSVTPPVIPPANNTETAAVKPKADISGNSASAKLSSADSKKLVEDAVANKVNEILIKPEIKPGSGITKTTISMASSAFKDIAEKTDADVKVETPVGSLTFDDKALEKIADKSNGSEISISVEKVDNSKLSEQDKKTVGDSVVINLSIMSGNEKISDFGKGTATISIPYKLKDGEKPEGIVIWYLDDEGTLTQVKDAYFDEKTGTVVFKTNHFSYYVIGYDKALLWNNPFTDIDRDAWYYNNVFYVNSNKIMNGTGKNSFNPNGTTDRGMIVTILWRLEGSKIVSADSFNDVGNTWYTDAVAWASSSNIVSGYGNGKFGPSDSITREQMALIIYNYAKFKGYDLTSSENLELFRDKSSISPWASEAMRFAVDRGIISGKGNSELQPKATATRAEAAAMIQRMIEKLNK